MHQPAVNRRDFHKLTLAALGGVVAGCGREANHVEVAQPKPADPAADVHVCRGLNACKGKGADGKNECAGQGTCASASTHHDCAEKNACKGQGGCGEDAARNACKGKGGCHVPLMESAWESARKHFEETLKKQEKQFGPAPPKPAKS